MRFLAPPQIRLIERAVSRAHRRLAGRGSPSDPSSLQPAWDGLFLARLLAAEGFLPPAEGHAPSPGEILRAGPGGVEARRAAMRQGQSLFPGIFGPAARSIAGLAPESEEDLAAALRELPESMFLADDCLGWAHQAWQSGRKTALQRGGGRIGSEGLGPVTQLFTDGYMAEYLVSRAFAGQEGGSDLPQRVMDPCCGAGAFLLAAMPRLVERWLPRRDGDVRQACDAALDDGLFGLEIDAYCAEIAVCSLVLASWRLPGSGGMRPLPRPRIACPGHALTSSREEWISLAREEKGLEGVMAGLWDRFSEGPILGSLVEPPDRGDEATWQILESALTREDAKRGRDSGAGSRGEYRAGGRVEYRAGGLLESARLLSIRYDLLASNVPYLNRPKLDQRLADFSAARYPEARRDLATVFVERCLSLCVRGGMAALVTPQNWLFLGAYRDLRRRLLRDCTWHAAVRLGEGAFGSGSATGAFAALLLLRAEAPRRGHRVEMVDAGGLRGADAKREALGRIPTVPRDQEGILAAEDARLVWADPSPFPPLGRFAESLVGLQNGDAPRYVRCFWELPSVGGGWVPLQGAPDRTSPVSGRSFLLRWEEGKGSLAASRQARIQGTAAWGRRGVAVRLMRHLDCALYDGAAYDQACAVLLPRDPADLPALWAFCSSGVLAEEVRRLDGKLNVTNAVLLKAPFDRERWQSEAHRAFPRGIPTPRCDDPAQWGFHGRIEESTEPLQVAAARLLGYRWPAETGVPAGGGTHPVLPLAGLRGRPSAADLVRDLLRRSFGPSWSTAEEGEMVRRAGCADGTLETWLRDRFFAQHLAVFRQRPFLWHVWDGRRDGFSALLLCHALDAGRLRALIDGPLSDWIRGREEGPGAERNAAGAARELRRKLLLILEGDAPHDVFVRWKPPAGQPIGWEPDWDDGVRANIRPFVEAGVLRVRPRIRWEADRGRDGPGGERRNDVHLTLAEKAAARRRDQ